jgi:hypothetical protein
MKTWSPGDPPVGDGMTFGTWSTPLPSLLPSCSRLPRGWLLAWRSWFVIYLSREVSGG